MERKTGLAVLATLAVWTLVGRAAHAQPVRQQPAPRTTPPTQPSAPPAAAPAPQAPAGSADAGVGTATDASVQTAPPVTSTQSPPPNAPSVSPAPAPASPTPATPPPVTQAPQPAAQPTFQAQPERRDVSQIVEGTTAENVELTQYRLEDLLAFELPDVTTASRREERATDAPGAVYVITADDIRLRGYSTLTDALRDVPGMETIEYYFSEWGTLVPVRGVAGNNKIIVLINGMRVNPPGGEAMMFRQDISIRQAHQIEIIYGPGSTLYGPDAISAVINIRTIRPDDTHWVEVGAGAGYPARYEVWTGLQKRFGENRLTLYAHWFDARELTDFSSSYENEWNTTYRPIAENKVVGSRTGVGLNPDRWDQGLNLMARFDISDYASVQAWHRQSSRSSSEGLAPTFAKIDEAEWSDMSTVIEASATAKLTDRVHFINSLTLNRYEVDPDSRYVFQGADGQWFLDDYKYGIGLGATAESRVEANITDRISLMGGVVVGHYDIIPKATIPGGADTGRDIVSQGGAFEYYTEPNDPASLQSVSRVNNLMYQNIGAYLEGAARLWEPLRFILGVRVGADTRFDTIPVNPRVAVIYNPTSELTLKGIFTTAFVAPAPYWGYNVYYDGTGINTANTELEPENAMSTELNATYNRDRLLVGASLYYNRQSDLFITGESRLPVNIVDPDIYLNPTDTQSIVLTQSANGGESRSFGGELYGRYSLSGLASFWASYSVVDFESKVKAMGMTRTSGLPGISAHNFRLGATVAPWANRLFITAWLVMRSTPENIGEFQPGATRVTTLKDETELPYEIGLHTLLNVWQGLDAYVDIRNITHHKYALAGLQGTAIPQETFRGMAGVRFRY